MRKRSYRQFCGLARALDVVGERWTLLIVRNLLLGPRRYGDLLSELPGITTNLLAKRLKEMEAAGLVLREERPPPLAAVVYRLTDAGEELEPAVLALAGWGSRYMDEPRSTDAVNLGWGLLSLKRRYTGGVEGVVALKTESQHFELVFRPDSMRVLERPADAPQVRVSGERKAFLSLFWNRPLPGGRGQRLEIEGDHALWEAALRALQVEPNVPGARAAGEGSRRPRARAPASAPLKR